MRHLEIVMDAICLDIGLHNDREQEARNPRRRVVGIRITFHSRVTKSTAGKFGWTFGDPGR